MANTLLTLDMITREALRLAHEKATFIGTINRQYDDSFAQSGAKIGDTLRIRMPSIKRMVRDAEAHAEEDRKFRELAETRNRADQLVHATEKALKDLGDKVSPEDRARVESAASDLKAVLRGDDKDIIAKKAEALAEASAKIAQQAYASQAGPEAGAAGAGGSAGGPAGGQAGGKDEVLDDEFEEVDKDKDRKG